MKEYKENELMYLIDGNYFVYHKGELLEATPVLSQFEKVSTDDEEDRYVNTITFKNNGELFTINDLSQVYSSKESFENGIPVEYELRKISLSNETDGNKMFQCLLGWKFKSFHYWIADHSNETDPFVEKVLPMNKFGYDYLDNKWGNPDMPSGNYYASRQEAIYWESYVIISEDGKKKTVMGRNKLLELDDDQKQLVSELKDILDKINNAGIFLVTDFCDNIYAYNKKNVQDLTTSYDNLEEDGYEACDTFNKKSEVCKICECSEDATVWIKRKE